MDISEFQIERGKYIPKAPHYIREGGRVIERQMAEKTKREIRQLFPDTSDMPVVEFVEGEVPMHSPFNVGVILSGGQAPGGHNVIAGLYDELKRACKDSRLFGFLMGAGGLLTHEYVELTAERIDRYRNSGGFDMIGSGRTKIEKESQLEKALEVLRELHIQALVIIGGDDSNTNAAVMAEYYKKRGIQVIGCPKTIDGDLKNDRIETSFGFDTACKVYSHLIGNIERDCDSARKYWYFIKLMGRSASHITLECALQTHPNICLISEEVREKKLTLDDICTQIASVVAERAARGINHGVVLVPEGLVEFIPSVSKLINEMNDLYSLYFSQYAGLKPVEQLAFIQSKLSWENCKTFSSLPEDIAFLLALVRDQHGNIPVSKIETEKLLSRMVGLKLEKWKKEGKYQGTYTPQHQFFGFEGRSVAPSNFDADYCYSSGLCAALLIENGKTGYMATVRHTYRACDEWRLEGVPLTMMLCMEKRKGEWKPVIQKALVDLKGRPFLSFASERERWAKDNCYVYPGPIQYWGPSRLCDQTTFTLALEHQ